MVELPNIRLVLVQYDLSVLDVQIVILRRKRAILHCPYRILHSGDGVYSQIVQFRHSKRAVLVRDDVELTGIFILIGQNVLGPVDDLVRENIGLRVIDTGFRLFLDRFFRLCFLFGSRRLGLSRFFSAR